VPSRADILEVELDSPMRRCRPGLSSSPGRQTERASSARSALMAKDRRALVLGLALVTAADRLRPRSAAKVGIANGEKVCASFILSRAGQL
jgi:hypothetical protein